MVLGLLGGSAGIVVVAVAHSIGVVLLGWCIAQVFFNALLAVLIAVLPDQVPVSQRGRVAGVLGICLPIASVSGTYVVQLFTGNTLAMFLAPCAIGGLLHPAVRRNTEGPPPGRRGQAPLVVAGVRERVLR